MPVTCPDCDNEISEDRINRPAALTCCAACGALWPLAGRAEPPRQPVEGDAYRLTFDGGRAQLDYRMRAGTAGTVTGRILLAAGIVGLLVDTGILLAFIKGAAGRTDFGYLPPLIFVSFGSLAVIVAGLFVLHGKGRLTMDARTALLRRELWGIGRERRYRLDAQSSCTFTDIPVFRAGKPSPAEPVTAQSLAPLTIDTLDGPLTFGFAVPPGDRPEVARAINAFLDAQLLPPDAFTIPRGAAALRPVCMRCARVVGPAAVDVPAAEIDCPFCNTCSPLTLDSARPASEIESERERLRPVPRPPKTKIVCERPAPERMVVYLPPHGLRGNTLFMFIFGVVWTLFTGVFGVVAVIATFSKGGSPIALLPLLFMLPFWAVGAGFLYFSLRGAYAKKFLSIESDRIVLRTVFAGRTKDEQAPRSPGLRAELAVAYSQNKAPVYRLQLGGAIKFGSELDSPEKDWLLFEINRFLVEMESSPA